MKFRWLRYGIALNLILAALAIAGAAFYTAARNRSERTAILEIRDSSSRKPYGEWPLEEAGEFAVEFIHSVHQSPVRETFKIEGKTIRPVKASFFSFGAGIQSDLEEGQTLSREGGALAISGFSASFSELNYIVGTVSDHLLYINGETVSLRDLCGKNAHIAIRIK